MDDNKVKQRFFKMPKGMALAKALFIIGILFLTPGILYYVIPEIGLAGAAIGIGLIFLCIAMIVFFIHL